MRWLLFLLCWPLMGWAQSTTTVFGRSVEVHVVGEAVNADTLEDAVVAVSSVLKNHSDTTGHEACAQICTMDKRYAAQATTVNSHIMCPVTNLCPEGFSPTQVSVHSHPGGHSYKINAVDKILLNSPFYKIGASEKRGKNNAFSQEDFAAGAGYMVNAQGEIFYQNGPKDIRKIK